jgi:hypothetical protein
MHLKLATCVKVHVLPNLSLLRIVLFSLALFRRSSFIFAFLSFWNAGGYSRDNQRPERLHNKSSNNSGRHCRVPRRRVVSVLSMEQPTRPHFAQVSLDKHNYDCSVKEHCQKCPVSDFC